MLHPTPGTLFADTCYSYQVGHGIECHSTNGSPKATRVPLLTTVPSWELLGRSRVYMGRRVRTGVGGHFWAPPPESSEHPKSARSRWTETGCWRSRILAGQQPHVRLGREFFQVPNGALERNDRLWAGPQTPQSSWGLAASELALATALLPVLFWKGIMWLLAPGNYHLRGLFFFSCVMSEKDAHKPCLRTVHPGITGISQSSFKNDVAI